MKAHAHLKQSHNFAKRTLPVISAGVALLGALASATSESKVVKVDFNDDDDADDIEEATEKKPYSPGRHFFSLIYHGVIAGISIVAVLLLLTLSMIAPPVSTAVVLTGLVLAALWAAEVIARK